jgi:hypothetical protein
VAAVAPRVRGRGGDGLLGDYAGARSPLDLGDREARVRPGARVGYVPTAALVVRRAALPPSPFDPALRYGEDVDLVWRLHDDGWTVRYDPRTVVLHDEPRSWGEWLGRRHAYGRSAAPLARRHGERLTPLVLPVWPTAAWLLLALGRPLSAVAAAGVPAGRLLRRLHGVDVPLGEGRGQQGAPRCAGCSRRPVAGGAGTVVARRSCSPCSPGGAPGALPSSSRSPRRCSSGGRGGRRSTPCAGRCCGSWTTWPTPRRLAGCWSARTLAPLRPRRARPR